MIKKPSIYVTRDIQHFLSDQKAEYIYRGQLVIAARAVEVLALETAKPFAFSSHFHILALACIIGKPIQSVYPDIPALLAIVQVVAVHRRRV